MLCIISIFLYFKSFSKQVFKCISCSALFHPATSAVAPWQEGQCSLQTTKLRRRELNSSSLWEGSKTSRCHQAVPSFPWCGQTACGGLGVNPAQGGLRTSQIPGSTGPNARPAAACAASPRGRPCRTARASVVGCTCSRRGPWKPLSSSAGP